MKIVLNLKHISKLHFKKNFSYMSTISDQTADSKISCFTVVLICFDSIQIFGEIASLSFQISWGHHFLTEVKVFFFRFWDFSIRSFKFLDRRLVSSRCIPVSLLGIGSCKTRSFRRRSLLNLIPIYKF